MLVIAELQLNLFGSLWKQHSWNLRLQEYLEMLQNAEYFQMPGPDWESAKQITCVQYSVLFLTCLKILSL